MFYGIGDPEENQGAEIPDRLIKEGRVHLDEHLITEPDRVGEHVLVQHVRVHDGFLDPHREQ